LKVDETKAPPPPSPPYEIKKEEPPFSAVLDPHFPGLDIIVNVHTFTIMKINALAQCYTMNKLASYTRRRPVKYFHSNFVLWPFANSSYYGRLQFDAFRSECVLRGNDNFADVERCVAQQTLEKTNSDRCFCAVARLSLSLGHFYAGKKQLFAF
jgi:hypothetical protein